MGDMTNTTREGKKMNPITNYYLGVGQIVRERMPADKRNDREELVRTIRRETGWALHSSQVTADRLLEGGE
tara:strand:- start:85 stop:297 length:213 start_codon:yes stop_codon:yes gene_type:complete